MRQGAAVELLFGEDLFTRAASGNACSRLGLVTHLSNSFSGLSIRTGQVVLANDAYNDTRINQEVVRAMGIRAMIAVPLYYQGDVVGVLKVFSDTTDTFNDLDLQTLQLTSSVIAAAISDANLYARARDDAAKFFYEATHDALTGLANRALLFDRLKHEISMAKRQNEGFAILIADLDEFKRINDKFGHPAGDKALIAAAGRLTGAVRECDTVARVGGDEFAIHLVGVASEAGVSESLDRIRTQVQGPVQLEDCAWDLRMSVGYALFPQDGATIEAIIAVADERMYKMKLVNRRVDVK